MTATRFHRPKELDADFGALLARHASDPNPWSATFDDVARLASDKVLFRTVLRRADGFRDRSRDAGRQVRILVAHLLRDDLSPAAIAPLVHLGLSGARQASTHGVAVMTSHLQVGVATGNGEAAAGRQLRALVERGVAAASSTGAGRANVYRLASAPRDTWRRVRGSELVDALVDRVLGGDDRTVLDALLAPAVTYGQTLRPWHVRAAALEALGFEPAGDPRTLRRHPAVLRDLDVTDETSLWVAIGRLARDRDEDGKIPGCAPAQCAHASRGGGPGAHRQRTRRPPGLS